MNRGRKVRCGLHRNFLFSRQQTDNKRNTAIVCRTSFLLHIGSDENSGEKWINAARSAMAHIPMIDKILDVTREKEASEVQSLIAILANISGGQNNRMFFPINMLARAYHFHKSRALP
ncbi:hypothetical protein ABEB36_011358 [Hypothenemus hampei]|uniref:Uncharacterized protein n=1 Tax=Hypothenemus hampei TaxID=57062 RepID=A0ABD1EF55_HYPHA